jgi:hypothetical protein
MLVTHDGGKLRTVDERISGAGQRDLFPTDARRHKDEEIAAIRPSFRSQMPAARNTFRSRGRFQRSRQDKGLSTPAKAWWDSADDPNIRVLKITPDDAEFWDSPGTVISYVKMAAAAATGTRPEIGENRKVSM